MTKMTGALALIALVLCAPTLQAQEFKVPVPAGATITLLDFPGNLPIEGYNGTDIIISGGTATETPDRAKGLKPIYPGGEDNTGQGIALEKSGNMITLRYLLPITQEAKNYKIKIPEGAYLKIKSGCERNTGVTLSNLKGEIDVDVCSGIKLKNVTGPLVLSTINGNVDVTFTTVSKDKPISIATINGEIDVTLPAATPANIEMSNISGNMYSDFDFHTDDKNMKRIGGNSVNTQINGGGLDIKLHTINGNIYLRKG
jgi:lia operon protein LiaG